MTPRCLTILVLSGSLVGCVQPAMDVLRPRDPSLVWPKAPDSPRIRFLGELTGSDDVRSPRGVLQSLHELVHGPRPPSRLSTPHAVAVHPTTGQVAIADPDGACVHVFDLANHTYRRQTTCGPGGQSFEAPVAVAWMEDRLWVADARRHAVAILPPGGPGRWIGRNELQRPAGMAFCSANGLCYVVDAGAHAVLTFDRRGKLIFQFGSQGAGPGQLNFPSQICCGPDDTLVVADSLNFRIQRFGLDGSFLGVFGRKGDAAGDFALPKGVAVDPDGHLWVVDAQFENVQGFTQDGELLLAFGGEGRRPGQFWLPAGVFIDASRRMWIADSHNRRVQVFELLR